MDRAVAATSTKLLPEPCAAKARAPHAQGGSHAIELAFGTPCQPTMMQRMTDPVVVAGMSAFEKHVDQEKIARALTGQ